MNAAVIDVGDNIVKLGLALITLATLMFNNRNTSRAVRAAEQAANQLTNNGGSTALDKLQAGQQEVLVEVAEMRVVVERHSKQLDELTRDDKPQ